jgi:hypothetical protein
LIERKKQALTVQKCKTLFQDFKWFIEIYTIQKDELRIAGKVILAKGN